MANPIPNLFKIPELKSKILFTLLALAVYRIGAHITAPGIDVGVLQQQFANLKGGLFGVYDMFVGGALSRATVFALGIMPYISASIMFQLLAAVFPTVEKMQKEGEEGRKKLTQWTRYVTVALAMLQGYGYGVFVQNIQGAVRNPGMFFLLSTALVLTFGAVFIMWLGEQITERGIGNGMSLLIFFSIVEGFPGGIASTIESVTTDVVSPIAVIVMGIV
ncbi:MAG TPA: preprotein translocase subunit SecY, partial [Longimicrobiales bacterium]